MSGCLRDGQRNLGLFARLACIAGWLMVILIARAEDAPPAPVDPEDDVVEAPEIAHTE